MFIKGRKSAILLLAGIFLLTQIMVTPVSAQSAVSEALLGSNASADRICGDERYKTAVAVSQKGWETSDYAVLARGDNFTDALCAGPLAQKYGGPILLTPSTELNVDTTAELKRLGVKHLFIAGGLGAISQNVEDALQESGIATIERIYGDDRYETSAKIAQKISNTRNNADTNKVVLATGENYPDALSISAIAAKLGMPILLTAKDSLPVSISDYFNQNTVAQTYVIGGTNVISDTVAGSVPNPARIAGSDRYATNVATMQRFADELNYESIYIATGVSFADALTGAVLSAKTSSPLVLTDKNMPAETTYYLQTILEPSNKVVALGGSLAVPLSVLSGLVITEKYSAAGVYGPETGYKTCQGSIIICSPDVTLQNMIIEGNLLLDATIGDGDIHLNDITVKGQTIINGMGSNNAETNIILSGSFEQLDVEVSEVNVTLASGSITTMNISNSAAHAKLKLEGESSVGTLNVNAQSEVTGQGKIAKANITGKSVIIEQKPATTVLQDGLTAQVGGKLRRGINYQEPASITVLVNKKNALPADYVPVDLVEVNIPFTFTEKTDERFMRKEAAGKLTELCSAAKKENLIFYGVSGYRSYQTQKDLFARNTKKYGSAEKANWISARAGQSEHQAGLAIDVTSQSVYFNLVQLFGDTKEYRWLEKNAHQYGFIIRYPKGKESITGYSYEPWHIRYIGKDLATELYEEKLTYEEYIALRI